MKWCSAWVVAVLSLLLGGAAGAQQGTIEVELMVSHISEAAGDIDSRGQRLHAKLKDQFRYESLRVLETRKLKLATDQVGSVTLPNGKQARVRPLQVDAQSALLAVEVEGAVKTDLRVKNGHLVVIGAERYDGGKLVVSLEPRW